MCSGVMVREREAVLLYIEISGVPRRVFQSKYVRVCVVFFFMCVCVCLCVSM